MLRGRGTYRVIVAMGVCQYTEFGVGSSFSNDLSFCTRFGHFPLLVGSGVHMQRKVFLTLLVGASPVSLLNERIASMRGSKLSRWRFNMLRSNSGLCVFSRSSLFFMSVSANSDIAMFGLGSHSQHLDCVHLKINSSFGYLSTAPYGLRKFLGKWDWNPTAPLGLTGVLLDAKLIWNGRETSV